MTAKIIDGRAIAQKIRNDVKQAIDARVANGLPAPGLDVILVGNNPSSTAYVQQKQKACQEVGIISRLHQLPESVSTKEVAALIERLNDVQNTHGILLQLPLPSQMSEANELLELIRPEKDVDGFHPFNIGRLAQGRPLLRPCTPYGIIHLLNAIEARIPGSHAVVVGSSNIVGRPMALELLLAKCTVTVCHRLTTDLAKQIEQADILVAAIGNPGVIKSEWIKPGAIAIDVGFTRMTDGRIAGDIDFANAVERASWITPVPGGVGPMTVATLMQNTLLATELIEKAI